MISEIDPNFQQVKVVVDEYSKNLIVGGVSQRLVSYRTENSSNSREAPVEVNVEDVRVFIASPEPRPWLVAPMKGYLPPWVTSQCNAKVQEDTRLKLALRSSFDPDAASTESPFNVAGLVGYNYDLFDMRLSSKKEHTRFLASVDERSNYVSQAIRTGGLRSAIERDPSCVRTGSIQFIDDECWVVNNPGRIRNVYWLSSSPMPVYHSQLEDKRSDNISWKAVIIFEAGVGVVELQVDTLLAGGAADEAVQSFFIPATDDNAHKSPFVAAKFVWYVEESSLNCCSICPIDLHLALWSDDIAHSRVVVFMNGSRRQTALSTEDSSVCELTLDTHGFPLSVGDGTTISTVEWRRLRNGTLLTIARDSNEGCRLGGSDNQLDVYSVTECDEIGWGLSRLFEDALSHVASTSTSSPQSPITGGNQRKNGDLKPYTIPLPDQHRVADDNGSPQEVRKKYAFKESDDRPPHAAATTPVPSSLHPFPADHSQVSISKVAAIPLWDQRGRAESAMRRQKSSSDFSSPSQSLSLPFPSSHPVHILKIVPTSATTRATGGERLKAIEVNRRTGAAFAYGYPHSEHCVFASGHHYLTKAASANINALGSFVKQFGPIRDFHIVAEGKCRSTSGIPQAKIASTTPLDLDDSSSECDGSFAMVTHPDRKPFACGATSALTAQASSYFGLDAPRQSPIPSPINTSSKEDALSETMKRSPSSILEKAGSVKRKHIRVVVESYSGAIAVVTFGVSGGYPSPGRIEQQICFGNAPQVNSSLVPPEQAIVASPTSNLIDISQCRDIPSRQGNNTHLQLVAGLYNSKSEGEVLVRVWYTANGLLFPLFQHWVKKMEVSNRQSSSLSLELVTYLQSAASKTQPPAAATAAQAPEDKVVTRDTLVAFMKEKCPEKERMLDILLKAVKGDCEKLLVQLVAKYGEWIEKEEGTGAVDVANVDDDADILSKELAFSPKSSVSGAPMYVTFRRVASDQDGSPSLQLSVWCSKRHLYGRSVVTCELGRVLGLWELSSGASAGLLAPTTPTGISASFATSRSLTDSTATPVFRDVGIYPYLPEAYRCQQVTASAPSTEYLCVGGLETGVISDLRSPTASSENDSHFTLEALFIPSTTISTATTLTTLLHQPSSTGVCGALFVSGCTWKVVVFIPTSDGNPQLLDVVKGSCDGTPSVFELNICEGPSALTVSVRIGDYLYIFQRDAAKDFFEIYPEPKGTESCSARGEFSLVSCERVSNIYWNGSSCLVISTTSKSQCASYYLSELASSRTFKVIAPHTIGEAPHCYKVLPQIGMCVLSQGTDRLVQVGHTELSTEPIAAQDTADVSFVKQVTNPLSYLFEGLLQSALLGEWMTLHRLLQVICVDEATSTATDAAMDEQTQLVYDQPISKLCRAIHQHSQQASEASLSTTSSRLDITRIIQQLPISVQEVGEIPTDFTDLITVTASVFDSRPTQDGMPQEGAPLDPASLETLESLCSLASTRLMEREIVGLDGSAQMGLVVRIETIRELLKQEGRLDAGSKRLIAFWKLRATAKKFQRAGQGLHSRPPSIPLSTYAWCLLSEAQDQLTDLTNPSGSWAECSEAGVPLWMKSLPALRKIAEDIGKNVFQKTRAIRECGFWYCLAKKISTLANLCKAVNDTKLQQFFQRDFTQDRHQEAASNNAYAAISKGMVEYGCGFFLLAGDGMSAAMSVVQRTQDWVLGLFIIRLGYDDDPVRIREYYSFLEGSSDINMSPWMRCILEWRMGNQLEAIQHLWEGHNAIGMDNEDTSTEALRFLQHCCNHVTIFTRRKDDVLPLRVHSSLLISTMRTFRQSWNSLVDSLPSSGCTWGRSTALMLSVVKCHIQALPILIEFAREVRDQTLPELQDINKAILEIERGVVEVAQPAFQADFNTGQIGMFGSDSDDNDDIPMPAAPSGATPAPGARTDTKKSKEELLALKHQLERAAVASPRIAEEARRFVVVELQSVGVPSHSHSVKETVLSGTSPRRALAHLAKLWLLSERFRLGTPSSRSPGEFESAVDQIRDNLELAVSYLDIGNNSVHRSPTVSDPSTGHYNRAGVANLAVAVLVHTLSMLAAYYRIPALAAAICLAKGITSYPTERELSDGIASTHCVLKQYAAAIVSGMALQCTTMKDAPCSEELYRYLLLRSSQTVRSLLVESFGSVWSTMSQAHVATSIPFFAHSPDTDDQRGNYLETLPLARLLRTALLQSSTLIAHQQTTALMFPFTFIAPSQKSWLVDGSSDDERKRIGGGIRIPSGDDVVNQPRFVYVDENSMFTEMQHASKCLVHILSCFLLKTDVSVPSADEVSSSLQTIGRDLCSHALEGSVLQPVLPLWSDLTYPIPTKAMDATPASKEGEVLKGLLFPSLLTTSMPSVSLSQELMWMWSLTRHYPCSASSAIVRAAKIINKIQTCSSGGVMTEGLLKQLALDYRSRGSSVRLLRLLEMKNQPDAKKSGVVLLPGIGCGYSTIAVEEHPCTALCIDNSSRDSCYVASFCGVHATYGLRDLFVCPEKLEFIAREQAQRDHATVAFSLEYSALLSQQEEGPEQQFSPLLSSSVMESNILLTTTNGSLAEVTSPTGHRAIVNPEQGRNFSSGLSAAGISSPVIASPTFPQPNTTGGTSAASASSKNVSMAILPSHQSRRSLASLCNTVFMESHPHLPVFITADGSGKCGVFQFGNDERLSYFHDPSCAALSCIRFSAQGYNFTMVGSSSGSISVWKFGPAPSMLRCLPHFFSKEGGAACYLHNHTSVVAVCGTDLGSEKPSSFASTFSGSSSSSGSVSGRLALIDTASPAPLVCSVALPFPYPKHIFHDSNRHPDGILIMDANGNFCIFDIPLRRLRPLSEVDGKPIYKYHIDIQKFPSQTPSSALGVLHAQKHTSSTKSTISVSAIHVGDGLLALGTTSGEVALFDAWELLGIGAERHHKQHHQPVDLSIVVMPLSVQSARPDSGPASTSSSSGNKDIVDIKFAPSGVVFATREGRVHCAPTVSEFVKSLFSA